MTTFTIYSIGDSAFLEQVLIAVAMITGSGDFTKMVSVGLLLGVLMICIQSVFQGAREINFQQILMGWILYACLFGPISKVTIEDAYTGQVRVVANIPIGVSFAGGVISNIGYTITKLFETGYGTIVPSVTQNRFNESLKLLNNVRRQVHDTSIFTALNLANGGGYIDTRLSWNNYIRECTLTKIDLNLTSIDNLMNDDLETALRFNSQLYGTRLYLNPSNPNGEDYTCTAGWAAINGAMSNLNSVIVVNALNNLLGIDTSHGGNAITKINNSLQAMGAISTSATQYLKVAVLEPLYYEAASGRYQDLHDYSSALMVNQAIQQRNTQWAAEQTMFMTIVRPMLTFFEGFIYAITPIMGFIVVIGSMGVQLIGRYVQIILWIQLWLPVLSIINLFIYTAASREMASLSSVGINSMYALSSTGDILQNWIATGGMLVAATPLISLFVVTGSSYAFTNLATRINGADHINEKIQSQDLLKPGPIMDSQPAYTHNQFSGAVATGSEGMISTMNLGSSLSSGVSSAQAHQSQKSSAFQSTLSNSITEGTSQEQAYSRLSSIGRTMSSQNTTQSQLIEQQAKSFMDKFQIDDSHSDAVKGVFALNATGSAGAATSDRAAVQLKASIGASGTSTSATDDSSKWSAADISQYLKGVSFSSNDSQALTNQLAEGFSRQSGESFKHTWGDAASQNLSKSASELVSATNSFSTMSQMQKQMSSMTNTDFKTLGGAIANNPEAMKHLNEYFQNAPMAARNEAAELEGRYLSYGMSPEVAQSAARLTAMTNPANYERGKELAGYQAALKTINLASGRQGSYDENAYQSQNIGDLKNNTQLKSPTPSSLNAGDMAQTSPRTEVGQLPTTSSLINNDYSSGVNDLYNKTSSTERTVSSPEEMKSRNNLLNSLPSQSWSATSWGAAENGKEWVSRKAQQMGGALSSGGSATAETFSGAMSQLKSMTPEQREQFTQSMQQNDSSIREKYGMAGGLISGMDKLGNNIIGAAITGYDKAKEWITNKSDISDAAKNMTLEEKGAFYAAAFSSAVEVGVDAGQQFMSQHGDDYKSTMASIGQARYGLTSSQAAVYAESFDTNPVKMEQAITNLKMDYANRNEDGSVMVDSRGKPILSSENEQFTDKLVNVIQNSTTAGDRAGSYLNAIKGYNIANQRFTNK